jgi:eukaryotic-like serine/threonine-protein kinase
MESQNLKSVFNEALDRPAGAERAAYLDEACRDDPDLRAQVEGLLRDHDQVGHFLETSAAGREAEAAGNSPPEPNGQYAADRPSTRPVIEGPGTRIGTYKLLQKIGEGGMGVVYMAEQEKPVRRKVALKIVKPGMDTDQVIARFEAERQALALMDHQNIARVLDGGTTDSGRRYFVMDLVKGVPITEYCDRNQLSPRERLELFAPVCQAIQHAHQKGLIHRDIKPSNVLVTLADPGAPGMPKVIDFGVAKAIDQRLTEKTMFTQFGMVVGTLEYMSPEQAGMGALDVDTRSDIYSLGVLLYELLTGSTPLDNSKLREAAYTEILRRIREEEPPTPSTRLSESKETLPSVSAQRHSEPFKLTRLVRGELDWIVMKALEKDRTRRYETASSFARDIERYLAGDPVEAGPPSATYKLRKLARKHRAALVTAGAFAGLLLLAAAISTWLAIQASRAERAARVAEAATRKERDRAVDAERKAQENLLMVQEQEKKAKQSESEARAVLDFFQNKVLAAARPKDQEGGLGITATIREAVDAAVPGIDKSFADQPAVQASIRDTLGTSYWHLGEPNLAISQFELCRQLLRAAVGPDHPDTLSTMNNLALAYYSAGRLQEAVALGEEALARFRTKFGTDDPKTLSIMSNLAIAYQDAGRLFEAVSLLKETHTLRKSKLGPDHPSTLATMNNLAQAYREADRLPDALTLMEETVKLKKAKLGLEHPSTLFTMSNLAATYRDAGRIADALSLFDETLRLQKAKLGLDHPDTLSTMNNLARTFLNARRLSDALPLFFETLKLRRARSGADHPHTLATMNNLVAAYLDAQRWPEAETLARECLDLRERKRPSDWERFHTMSQLGAALAGQKKYAEAEPLLLQGYDGLKAREALIPANRKELLADAAARIAPFYTAWGKPDKGAEWIKKLDSPKKP